MEYIDKNKSREWAHELIKEFLKRRLEEDGEYPKDLYAAFKGYPECKDAFVEKILEDNNHRCCYCMRDIKGTTLEHMIPQSVKTQKDFSKYFQNESYLDISYMILAQDFLDNPHEVPPYPHTIAYENLIPSCFGNLPSGAPKCCNNYRKDKFVQPLVFRPNIHEEVKYYGDGNIVWTEEPEDPEYPEGKNPTIVKLGLACLELKAIRRIWYYLSSHDLNCEDTNKNLAIDDLLIELGTPKDAEDRNMQQMLINFKKPEYWELLKKYTYFANKEIFE